MGRNFPNRRQSCDLVFWPYPDQERFATSSHDKFEGTFEELRTLVNEVQHGGNWINLGRCVCFRGGWITLVWWRRSGALLFEGNPSTTAKFRTRFYNAAGS